MVLWVKKPKNTDFNSDLLGLFWNRFSGFTDFFPISDFLKHELENERANSKAMEREVLTRVLAQQGIVGI